MQVNKSLVKLIVVDLPIPKEVGKMSGEKEACSTSGHPGISYLVHVSCSRSQGRDSDMILH